MSSKPVLQRVASKKIRIAGSDGLRYRAKALQRRVAQRAYELFESRGCKDGHDLEDWLCAERELLVPMPIELSEYDDSIIVQAQVPGFKDTELEISVDPRRLYISGKREQGGGGETGETLHSDVRSNEAFRAVDLHTEVDRDRVGLKLRDGTLYIVLPKRVSSSIQSAK